MHVLTSTKRFSHCLLMILTLAILTACSISPPAPEDTPPELFSRLNNNSAFFLKKGDLESEQENLAWQFAAVQALIAEKEFTLADSIIEYLQAQPLSAAEQTSLTLLIADNLYAQNESDAAQKALNKIDNKQLSAIGRIYFLKLQTQLQIDKEDHLGAAESLFLLTPLLQSDQERQQYNDILLAQLAVLPIDFLEQYQTTIELEGAEQISDTGTEIAAEPAAADIEQQFKQGWYALAALYQRYQLRPNQLIRSLNEWQARYPAHPVLSFMPTQLTNIPELSPYQPENIAVLIPLSGRFKQQGQAIQYGLLHAFYKQQQSRQELGEQAPGEQIATPPAPNFHFYDTQAQSAEQIVAQFKAQNIDFVIGPLQKNNIEAFLPLAEKMPVLTLNSFPIVQLKADSETEDRQIPWHYAFPLSPEEEAKQAAHLIFSEQHKKPLVLAPDSAYGKRLAQAFNEQWTVLNQDRDSQSETHFFSDKAKLAQFIAQALQTDQSKRRIAQMKVITGLPLKTKVRSRRDIDTIYIISKRDELILLKPFIEVAISPFAAAIPLYASSRSHLRDHHGKQNKELSKLIFSDSPFLLDPQSAERQKIQRLWSKQPFAILRLFALGFDSYQLIGQLMQLQNSADVTYNGLIGQLSLDQTNTVQAKLSWAKYQQGKLIEVSAPISAE